MTTAAPVLAQVIIAHNGTNYTFGAGATDKSLLSCRLTLSCDSKAGDTDIQLNDSTGTWDDFFIGGDSVTIKIGKSSGALTTVFAGAIDDIKTAHVMSTQCIQTIHAIDLSWQLLNRLVNAAYITLDPVNNPGQTIDAIVVDLITNPNRLVTYQNGLNRTGLTGITAATTANGGYVQPSAVHVQNKTFYNQSVNDCMQELANLGLAQWFIDSSGNVHFFQISNTGSKGSYASTQSLDNSLIMDLTKEDVYSGIYNVVGVVGGSVDAIDQHNETNSSYSPSLGNYYAVKFVAGQVMLDAIAIQMYKTQSNLLVPIPGLSGDIRYDNGGTPQGGPIVTQWTVTQDNVPTGSSAVTWVTIPCTGILQPGTAYWLVVYQSGLDSSNEYQIATGGSLTTATSSDGVTWTTHASTAAVNYRTYYAEQILSMLIDSQSIGLYTSRETVETDTTIASIAGAAQEAYAYLNVLAKCKRILNITAFPPDTIILPGQSVYVADTVRNVIGWYQTLDITYNIKDISCLSVNYTMASYIVPAVNTATGKFNAQ